MSEKRDYVSFQNNTPEKVALKYADGLLKDYGYGEKVLYTLTDGRVMFLAPDVAAKINLLDVQPGQPFWICKRRGAGKRAATRWDVYLDDPNPASAQSATPLERDLRLSIQEAPQLRKAAQRATEPAPAARLMATAPDLYEQHAAPPTSAPETALAAARKRPGWADTLLAQTNELTDVYAAALAHASQHGLSIRPEDVRALMTTAFISLSQRNGGSRNVA